MVLQLIFNCFSLSFRSALKCCLFKVTPFVEEKLFIKVTIELLKTSEGMMADQMKLPINKQTNKNPIHFFLKDFCLQFPNYTIDIAFMNKCHYVGLYLQYHENKPLYDFRVETIRILLISKPCTVCYLPKLPELQAYVSLLISLLMSWSFDS